MYLFCFLGNPGNQYEKTRHNAGWICEQAWAKEFDFENGKTESKFFCHIKKGSICGNAALFIKPTTFMNLSGKALLAVSQFYKIPTEKIMLIYDDGDLDFGMVRIRKTGSSGGHNGVKDCIRSMNTQDLARIKIGIKTNEKAKFASTADFVLANFSAEEQSQLNTDIIPKTLSMVQDWIQK